MRFNIDLIDQKNEINKLKIVHVDMDAFYASVEELDDVNLRGYPVIVGGLSGHGVVTTANYEARKYGIHSAMPTFKAKELCPQGIFLRPRMNRYRTISKDIFDILFEITDCVEKLSVDEAFLDISNLDSESFDVIRLIKQRIYEKVGLTLSIGLSYNKFLAKLASDWNKPNGFKYISKVMIPEVLAPLSISKVYGIGPKSQKRLKNIGIYKIEDLLRLEEDFLIELFNKSGSEIYNRIRGIDTREVVVSRERKSIGIERTFEVETRDKEILEKYLKEYSKQLEIELIDKNIRAKTIVIKIKDEDFRVQTRSLTLNKHIYKFKDIYKISSSLLSEININKKIRLLGITGTNLQTDELEQLSLFD